MKKMMKLALCSIFMSLTCAVYAENDALVAEEQLNDVIFTFMRQNQLLPGLFPSAKFPLESPLNEVPDVVRDLPFRGLYIQLKAEAEKLANAQKELARKELDLDEIQKEIDSSKNFLEMFEKMKEVFNNYPALAEKIALRFANLYDFLSILEGMSETELKLNAVNQETFVEVLRNLASKMSISEMEELLGLVFKNEIEQYKAFVEKNQDVLEKVSALADNQFNLKIDSKKCRTIRNKEFCTSPEEEREIKSLSEIMPYINSMDSTKAIEAGEL